MGSLGAQNPAGVKLPTIKLDTTLDELYKRASPDSSRTQLGWVSCGVTSGVDLTPAFPRNTKFIYQDQAFTAAPRHALNNGNATLQRSLAEKYLSHIPQRDAFVSGNTKVIFFNIGQDPGQIEHERREAEATISVLDPSQRPEIIFCPGPSKIPMKEHGIDRLEYKVVIDSLQGYPLTHDLETHWLLNSKAALARSGLPTPRSEVIEPNGHPPPADSCCDPCATAAADTSRLPCIPAHCTGPRGRWLAAQTARILSAVRARPVPFVLKTQQAFGGAGTWLVTTPAQKAQLLADLGGEADDDQTKKEGDGDGLLRKLLSLLTPSNAHLSPAAILLMDLIPHPKGDYGLTFFVTAAGEPPIFLAAAEQMLTDDGSSAWIGSRIDYARQDALHKKFEGLMGRIAAWVARHGYVGPVGADVLEAAGEGGAEEEEVFVVDLNVRTCGSVGLPLLRGHFTGRGLGCASSFSISVRGGRGEFARTWRAPLEEGRMVILSWYEDPSGTGESIADVVVGGEDEARLGELMRAVRERTEEVTF